MEEGRVMYRKEEKMVEEEYIWIWKRGQRG